MASLLKLSTLALNPLLKGTCWAVGLPGAADGVTGFLNKHFTNHSKRLTQALQKANDCAWRALEIALAGDSWWRGIKATLAAADEKAFREQVQVFLRSTPFPGIDGKKNFRQQCLRELQAARKAGVLTGGSLNPQELAREAGSFARFGDPQSLLDAEMRIVTDLAGELQQQGYGNLGWLLGQRPGQGLPLIVIAVRYFFRRAVETDQQLFQGLTNAQLGDALQQMKKLDESQTAGFAGLGDALDKYGAQLEQLLSGVQESLGEISDKGADTNTRVRHIEDQVQKVLAKLQLQGREVRRQDSVSIRGDTERRMVKQLLEEFRSLPPVQQRNLPGLLSGLGKLQHAAGNPAAAQAIFQEVAGRMASSSDRAEAHFNTFQAAQERREWPEALVALREAVRLDSDRFAPFPLDRYEPRKILGAGGFGTAFLCHDRNLDDMVVVKTLLIDDLERDAAEMFGEARVLIKLVHPAIIRLFDCNYVDRRKKNRAYIVMEYFAGETLEDYVHRHGPLSPEELLPLARQVAEGLRAAHVCKVFHRDVKPANILVREAGSDWEVKLIDFGLAVKQAEKKETVQTPAAQVSTHSGFSIAGTIDYAAPEQLGKLPGVPVGPYSDVYGFGKSCYYALTGTAEPDDEEKESLPDSWRRLLGQCTARHAVRRLADFGAVLERLEMKSVPAVHKSVDWQATPAHPHPVQPHKRLRPAARISEPIPAKPLDRELPKEVPVTVGARVALALYASAAMKKLYGIKDGGNPFEPLPSNVMEPLVRALAGRLAGAAADGRVSLFYWPCGSDSALVQEAAQVDRQQAQAASVTGPLRLGWGKMTRLAPVLKHLAEIVFPNAPQALCLILAPGTIEDLLEVESYSHGLAHRVCAGQRPPIKFVLVGLDERMEAEHRSRLNRLVALCTVRDPRGHEVALWDYRLTHGLPDVEATVAAVISRECR
jgi:serine/threonine protein kinase